MTISDAHRAFRFGMDKQDTLNYPNYNPEEIDLLFNQAQDRIIKQRYREFFEGNQKRIDDLREVIRARRDIPISFNNSVENITYNAVNFDMPVDYMILIWERAIINCTNCNDTITIPTAEYKQVTSNRTTTVQGIEVSVEPTTHNQLNTILDDEFSKADRTKILRLQYKDRVELIPPTDCTISYYMYRYIRIPDRVSLSGNVTFELADHLHQEIVDEAIKIALEGVESRRTGTFINVVDKQKE